MTRSQWTTIAFTKLSNVIGKVKAEEVLASTLRELGLTELRSANDLYRFAQRVIKLGGFVGAVGGLLSVHAVIHGATEHPPA